MCRKYSVDVMLILSQYIKWEEIKTTFTAFKVLGCRK